MLLSKHAQSISTPLEIMEYLKLKTAVSIFFVENFYR